MKSVLSFLFILSFFFSFSQTDYREKFVFGAKAGVNLASIYDEKGEDFIGKMKGGFVGGIFFTIPIGKFLAIQPEATFSQKGVKANGSIFNVPYSMKRTSNYIDVPVLLAVRPADFISILVGPQFAFHISSKTSGSLGALTAESQQALTSQEARGFVLGAHVGLDINIKGIVISPRATWDLQNNKGDGTSTDPSFKNFVLQFTLGYRF